MCAGVGILEHLAAKPAGGNADLEPTMSVRRETWPVPRTQSHTSVVLVRSHVERGVAAPNRLTQSVDVKYCIWGTTY